VAAIELAVGELRAVNLRQIMAALAIADLQLIRDTVGQDRPPGDRSGENRRVLLARRTASLPASPAFGPGLPMPGRHQARTMAA